jgi:tetratricopeptide (TPR) repeat protein
MFPFPAIALIALALRLVNRGRRSSSSPRTLAPPPAFQPGQLPSDERIHAALRQGSTGQAVAMAERRVGAAPDDPHARCLHAQALLCAPLAKAAEEAARLGLTLSPSPAEREHLLRVLYQSLVDQGRPADALVAAQDARDLLGRAQAYRLEAEMLFQLRRPGEAFAALKDALVAEPGEVAALEQAARLHQAQGDPTEAERITRHLLEQLPPTSERVRRLAALLRRRGAERDAALADELARRLQGAGTLVGSRRAADVLLGVSALFLFFTLSADATAAPLVFSALLLGVVFLIYRKTELLTSDPLLRKLRGDPPPRAAAAAR